MLSAFRHHLYDDFTNTRDFFEGLYLAAWAHWQYDIDTSDPLWAEKEGHAWMWLEGALAIASMDRIYCGLIGVLQSDLTCGPSDGVVPLERQRMPNPTASYVLVDVGHVRETGNDTLDFASYSQSRDVLRLALLRIGVPTRPAPALALSVGSIVGPSATAQLMTDAFSVAISGGTAPYAFRWSVNDVALQDGPSPTFEFTNTGADYSVTLRVEDAAGLSVTRAKSVTVTNCGGPLYC
ncbi:MAG: PKD domain-containing protein [Gemmatimonadetes bacterium]|nr:PKD domain-containing protein [Gemmatimonadota bacterium]